MTGGSAQDIVTIGNGPVFDGETLWLDRAARFHRGRFAGMETRQDCDIDLGGDILAPGYVDLQVNGGGGVMFNDAPSVATLGQIAQAHRALGVAHLLPTLITDTPAQTQAAIDAAVAAIGSVPGIAGLHLEGPHLSVPRKGAHEAAYIRPMTQADLDTLLSAAAALPCLMVTIAPESVTQAQVAALAQAGIHVSLGHTDARFDTCTRYAGSGARCVTHLFNAMRQMGSREPGLVGAALADGRLSAGLIADGHHVHPASLRTAWNAKAGPGQIFLVSDAMAVAGSDLTTFTLGGRQVSRHEGRLTLQDGTLAGADLDLTTALRVLTQDAGVDMAQALAAATTVPARLIGLPSGPDSLRLGGMIRIKKDLSGVSWVG